MLSISVGYSSVSASLIDFNSTVTNLFGDTAGDAIGDPVINQDGITMSVETFTLASFTDFNEARIDGLHPGVFATDALELDNISVLFDFSGVGFEVGQVTFEFARLGGGVNFAVNGGSLIELDSLFDLPQSPTLLSPGVYATVEPGLVTLNGSVDNFLIGGQELLIDNVTVTPIPEPTTIALFCCGLLMLAGRQYRRNANS